MILEDEKPWSQERYGLVFPGGQHVASWYFSIESARRMRDQSPKDRRPYIVKQTVNYSAVTRVGRSRSSYGQGGTE